MSKNKQQKNTFIPWHLKKLFGAKVCLKELMAPYLIFLFGALVWHWEHSISFYSVTATAGCLCPYQGPPPHAFFFLIYVPPDKKLLKKKKLLSKNFIIISYDVQLQAPCMLTSNPAVFCKTVVCCQIKLVLLLSCH